MSQIAIKVEDISKKYNLLHKQTNENDSLASALVNGFKQLAGAKKNNQTHEDFWALKDISFEINKGDRVGIIGRNGAGKSTLLKILSQIVKPTTGRIEYNGRMAALLEVGTGFHGDLTGRENIYLNGSILGMHKKEIDVKFDEIVAFSEVEQFLDTPVKRYSSGMYVRLAFAVAAHLEPDILIVDEVLAVGDAAFQRKCLGKMEEVSKNSGRTVLFVSHNMGAVQNLCNKGIMLQSGRLITQGNIHEVIKSYMDAGNAVLSSVFTFENQKNYKKSKAFFTKVELRDANENLNADYAVGDKVNIHLHFETTNDFDGVVVGIGIVSSAEQPVLTTWARPENFKTGLHQLVFTFENIYLAPSIYKIVVGISRGNEALDYNPDFVSLNISDIINIPERERLVNSTSGLLLNQLPYKFI